MHDVEGFDCSQVSYRRDVEHRERAMVCRV